MRGKFPRFRPNGALIQGHKSLLTETNSVFTNNTIGANELGL